MKRHFSIFAMTLLAAGLAFVSCEKSEPKDPDNPDNPDNPNNEVVKPVFPAAVNEALEAGGSYTLDIEPNVDWSIELKYDEESTGWFWIQDGNSQAYTVRGKAGVKASVTVCAGEQTDFDTVHSCTLEMTMGEETKTIATFTRGTVGRTFTLAYCQVEDNGSDYVYNEDPDSDLKYNYNEILTGDKPVIPLEWIIRTKDYRRSVLINANFDWQLKSKPEWMLDLSVTGAAAGEQVEFDLEGDPVNYPLEDASAELVFCAKENRDAEYVFTVQIPGCGDIFEVTGFSAETEANAAGEIYKESSMGEGSWAPAELGISGYVLGVNGTKVFTSADWVTAVLSDWSDEAGVIQERILTMTVTVNEGEERDAYVLAIPAAHAPSDAGAVFTDGQVNAEYEQYIVTHLVQSSAEGEDNPGDDVTDSGSAISFAYPDMVSGATLEHVSESNLEEMEAKYPELKELRENVDGNENDVAILTYNVEYPENVALIIPDHKWIDLKPGMDGPEWLTYEGPTAVDDKQQISVNMAMPAEGQPAFGIINIYESYSSSVPFAVIYCIPNFSDQNVNPNPEVTSKVSFATPDQVAGATLEPVGKANLAEMTAKYPQLKELKENVDGYGIDVVILKYTSANPENTALNIPSHKWIDVKPGMEGPEWLAYDGPANVEGQQQITVHMGKPGEGEAAVGIMNLYESYSASMPFVIIYCIPEF